MGVTSIRLNEREEKLLNFLKEYYGCESSTILKRALFEMYEDIKDKEIVEEYEKEEKQKKIKFKKIEEILK
ncbi:MAG: DUF6290 family protein [Chitinispirillaceae bacterium]|nr:DUF6290 family protein [Chitinispirillaceae bacterium]